MNETIRHLRVEIAAYEQKRDWRLDKKLYRVAAKHQRSIDSLLKRIYELKADCGHYGDNLNN